MINGSNLQIIDFGFASRYRSKDDRRHLEQKEVPEFQGNVFFASANQMNFQSTGRRDDLISLVYLLVYLLNRGNLLDMVPLNAYNIV